MLTREIRGKNIKLLAENLIYPNKSIDKFKTRPKIQSDFDLKFEFSEL